MTANALLWVIVEDICYFESVPKTKSPPKLLPETDPL